LISTQTSKINPMGLVNEHQEYFFCCSKSKLFLERG